MNDADLRKTLSALPVPSVDSAARERGLHRALVALAQPQPVTAPVRTSAGLWRGALVALAVGLGTGVLVFRGKVHDPAAAIDVAHADALTLAQMQSLFPGQLNAVIERDGAVQLDLAGQSSDVASAQPLVVQLERGGQRWRVLSYSGRTITLELQDGRVIFEALVTSEGGVVLSGRDFVWNSAQPGSLAGYRVNAQPLDKTL